MRYYEQKEEEVFQSLGSSQNGLAREEAARRRERFGPNRLADAKQKSLARRFFEQMANPMIIVLIVSAILSGIIGEMVDMTVILLVVVLNAILGVVQESKSEKAIQALQAMTTTRSKVRRSGTVQEVDSHSLVPGDVVLLEAGDAVPADMRLFRMSNLKIDESALTGESVPVEKSPKALSASGGKQVPLGDRLNMAYMGCNVVYGRGEGVVTATGMKTEMGKIAGTLAKTREEATPLQQKLNQLSNVLSIGVLAICAFVFVFDLLRSGNFSSASILNTFMLAVSLAVAAVPEGLAAVVTIVLSIGVTNLSKRNAIIRKLTAVETLGCTQVICTDKTGTLTQNRMTVTDFYGDAELLPRAMALGNDSELPPDGGEIVGEPTENAMVAFGLKHGYDKNKLEQKCPRTGEAPFDSRRKMMSAVHVRPEGGFVQFTTGAPDMILKKCTQAYRGGRVVPLTDEIRREAAAENRRMGGKALRVLAAACRTYDAPPKDFAPETLEKDLVFVGLAGMIDPVRPEVPPAVQKCRKAGIRPVMITGDHRVTAAAIARELGIIHSDKQVVTGSELNEISDEELKEKVPEYGVYARVQPEHKVRIVQAWKARGMVTAMTGDGVNDAPALKAADIGTGMGITGTDVTKNAADMVLTDDNFATIVSAVEEGRRIYDNIRKAIQFLLSSNLSEVVAVFASTMAGFILMKPVHLLWINLITDSFPAVALGMEKAEPGIMQRPPRPKSEGLFANGVGFDIIYQSLVCAALTLAAYFCGEGDSQAESMTMAFVTLSTCEVFHSINMRARRKSIFALGSHNKYLFGAMLFALLLPLAMMYIPPFAAAFSLVALPAARYFESIGLALLIIPIVEIVKAIQRWAARR